MRNHFPRTSSSLDIIQLERYSAQKFDQPMTLVRTVAVEKGLGEKNSRHFTYIHIVRQVLNSVDIDSGTLPCTAAPPITPPTPLTSPVPPEDTKS
jgi:hypothetical protein